MLLLLLNLASQCWGQNQQLPTPSLQAPQSQQVVQNALNQKFSVFGGTVTGPTTMSTTTVQQLCFLTDGSCQTTAFITGNNLPQPSWQGINYWLAGSSGTTVAYTTGTIGATGVDSFHIADSSWVVNGAVCHTIDTTFTLVRSTNAIAWLDLSCNLHVSGIVNTSWVSIASYTVVIGDGIPIAISTSGASGEIGIFTIVNNLPIQSFAAEWATRGSLTNNINTTAGTSPDQWWNCQASHNIFPSCQSGVLTLLPTSVKSGTLSAQFSGTTPQNNGATFVVNNIGSGSQNINFQNYSAGNAQVSIDGNGLTTINNGVNSTNISVGTGRHIVIIQSFSEGGISWNFPYNMKFVRPGPV